MQFSHILYNVVIVNTLLERCSFWLSCGLLIYIILQKIENDRFPYKDAYKDFHMNMLIKMLAPKFISPFYLQYVTERGPFARKTSLQIHIRHCRKQLVMLYYYILLVSDKYQSYELLSIYFSVLDLNQEYIIR